LNMSLMSAHMLRNAARQQRRLYSISSSSQFDPALAGTAPVHQTAVFLHTRKPPTSFPKRVVSKVQKELQLLAIEWRGIVNFSWSPEQQVYHPGHDQAEWDEDEEVYHATAYSQERRLQLDNVSMKTLDAVNNKIRAHATSSSRLREAGRGPLNPDDSIYLYVCTHAKRDCRCGTTGVEVFEALRNKVRDLPTSVAQKIRVASVGHVGGHKYAANVLVYPSGTWLGNVGKNDVPEVLAHIMQRSEAVHPNTVLLPKFWRGRMGLDKEEQLGMPATSVL